MRNSETELLKFEDEFRRDPLVMRQYLMAERAHLDYLANLEYKREEGFKKGLRKGRNEIIRTIRAKGTMTDEQIASLLDLPVHVVEKA